MALSEKHYKALDNLMPDLHRRTFNQNDISDYYHASKLGYSIFHSREGAMHMGLSESEKLSKEDHLGQAKRISSFISEHEVNNVLEVGSGRGFNTKYLSALHPNVQFMASDINEMHVKVMRKMFKNTNNAEVSLFDFHNVSNHQKTYDLIFGIETLCYSDDLGKLFTSLSSAISSGGHLIVFDGYRVKKENNEEELKRMSQMEKGMMVNETGYVEEFTAAAKQHNLALILNDDLTKKVLPTLKKFEFLAKAFFKFPLITRILSRVLPDSFVINVASGLLFYENVSKGLHSYNMLVFEKK